MNIKRWNELRELEKNNPDELERIGREIGAKVGISWAKPYLTAMDVMVAENKLNHPDIIKNIHEWIK